MSLLMFDGFEAFTQSSAPSIPDGAPWKDVGAIWYFDGTPDARTGARALTSTNVSGRRTVTQDLADPATLYVGCGIYWQHSSFPVIRLRGEVSGDICDVYLDDATGEYVLRSGDATELFRGPLTKNVWAYFEVGVTVNGATSSVELRVNGTSAYSNGSLDLAVGSNTGVRDVMFIDEGTAYTNPSAGVDDVYLCDGSGTEHNTFLGPVRVHALSPNADDAVTWTPNAGTTNYTQVDDVWAGHDGDSSYVASNTVGEKDLYGLEDLAAEYQNPVAVQTYWAARHDDSSGGASMAALLKSGATEVEGGEAVLNASYRYYVEPIQATNPDTGAAWTPAEINALQIGAVVKSNL